jgi:hypothetical protein
VTALFPPQYRDWALPSEAPLTPHAAERVSREAAQKSFDEGARSINRDFKTNWDGKQIERWSQKLGEALVRQRDQQTQAMREGRHPQGPANAPQLLVIGIDGGRWQGREKDPDTNSRWRENKVGSISSYIPGDGTEDSKTGRPSILLTTHVATTRDTQAFGPMVLAEAERRGYRQAPTVIGMGDGGNWIDPLFARELRLDARVIDWCHASEHLWDCAKAIHGPQTPGASAMAEHLEAFLWDGKVSKVIERLSQEAAKLGEPQEGDPPQHPRRVLQQNVGYFTRHQDHMRYPEYRAKGWPIGSGVTEAGVKQFNKRVKGTEQFWDKKRLESILVLRAEWISQDDRWDRYWQNRPAYVK